MITFIIPTVKSVQRINYIFCLKGVYKLLGKDLWVAVDEGNSVLLNGIDGTPGMTLGECEQACTDTADCNSFAHCPNDVNRCWMKDRVFKGNEPTKYKYYCSTFYREGNYTFIHHPGGFLFL